MAGKYEKANKKAAAVYIACDLKSKGDKSIFSGKYMPRAIRDIVLAAKFLIKCELI